MTLKKLSLQPGLNRDQTTTSGSGGWYECDKIRFLSGFPEKIGGWVNVYLQPILGICRQIFNYATSRSDNLLFYGTNKKVYVAFGGRPYDITPLRTTFTSPVTNNCFAAISGSPILTVTINNHGAKNGDYVDFSGVVSFAGIPVPNLNGPSFEIFSATQNTFQINVGVNAAFSDPAGGGTSIAAAFELPVGPAVTTLLIGWGTGTWGTGTWGEANASIDAIALQRDWFFDNFDDDVVMNYRRGSIYYWTYQSNFSNNRAVLLSSLPDAVNVPDNAMQTLVAQNGHLLAFGCQPYLGAPNDYDPLLIRWASLDLPQWWTIGGPVTPFGRESSAGEILIKGGTQIVRAFQTRQEILVWTESALYSVKETEDATVFSIETLAPDISIMGVRAVASVNDVIYWMGKNRFYIYSGRVETMPCTLRNHIFKNFNYDQFDQVVAGTNELYGEIWWFYPTANSLTNDAYVVFNYLEKVWYYGYMNRTAWLDSSLQQYPIGADPVLQRIYYHENGWDADGAPMESYILSADMDLDEGNKLVLTRRVIPDVSFTNSTAANPRVYMSFKSRDFPGAAYNTTNSPPVVRTTTVPIEQFTNQIFMRTRARQLAFEIRSTDLGVAWQLGTPRIDGRPDGRR